MFVVQRAGILEHGKRHGDLALELIGHANHGHLGHIGMAGDALLDLARAQAVSGHVDHVIRAAQDEVVAILVAHRPVVYVMLPLHCLEEWRFPGGFHYNYNMLRRSRKPDRYPMNQFSVWRR